jgi:uroporphyrinogen decarboxylase
MDHDKIAVSPYRKRVFQTLSFSEPDFCPYYIWIDEEMEKPLADHFGDPDFRNTVIRDHVVMNEIRALEQHLEGDLYRDDFGVIIKQGNIPYVDKPALAEPDLNGYTFPDLSSDAHTGHIDAWIERYKDRFRIVNLVEMFSERTWFMRGFEQSMTDYYLNRRFMEELLDGLMEVCLRTTEELLRRYGDRIDAVGMTDDAGSEHSMLLGPELWRQMIKPRLAQIYRHIKRAGKKCYFHSCGSIRPIVPDLIDIGIDMIQPLQPESLDIFELKREFGKDICLVGGISTQKTLPFGTPHDVVREVDLCLEKMAAGGGYILAPAKPILPGVPIENAAALIDRFIHQQSTG